MTSHNCIDFLVSKPPSSSSLNTYYKQNTFMYCYIDDKFKIQQNPFVKLHVCIIVKC